MNHDSKPRNTEEGFTHFSAVLTPKTDDLNPTPQQVRKIRKLSKRLDENPLSEEQTAALTRTDTRATIDRLERFEGATARRTEQDTEKQERRDERAKHLSGLTHACQHHWLAEGYCRLCGSEKASVEAEGGTR